MPSNYDQIRADNIREYGEGTRHLSFLGRLYTDRTHFVFELLQNAEDAGASKMLFQLSENQLDVFHDGRLFDEKDVRGICGVGEGTKAEDLTQIGKFGIGFKSVYAYTPTPEVHSGDESFKIDNYVRPYSVKAREIGDSWTTLFVFPFNKEEVKPEIACREIRGRLRKLSARPLLFLRKIKEIEYKLPDGTGGVYLRDETIRGGAREVTVIGQNNGMDESETWLIFERPVEVPDPSKDCPRNVPVEIGFRLMNSEKIKKDVVVKVKESPLVVFFPTEKETRFGFLIQGPYKTTPARDNIPKDDDWNAALVKETAGLLADVLPLLKEMGFLTVSLLEALPIRIDDFPRDSMFKPIAEIVREALITEELLPADGETFVSAKNAKLARGSDLRRLLNHDQLSTLFESGDSVKWLVESITQDRTPELRTYLLNELGVEEVTPDSFARKINQLFLISQTDEWLIQFYRYLSSQEALWRSPRWSGDAGGILRSKAILRLQNDSHVAPFRSDETKPNAYLPPQEETDFPTVKRSISENEQALNFFKRLGLSEPDVFDEIVERVLPKYMNAAVSSIPVHEHEADIRKILRAMASDSEAGKKKVIQAARQTPFLRAKNQSSRIAFKKPGDIYVRRDKLTCYFSGNPDIWFLDETEGQPEWLELGVASKPRFIKLQVVLPWDERSRLRGNQGHTRDIETIDYDLDGLDNFLSRFSEDNQQSKRYSLIIWDFLLKHLKESTYYQFYDGQYRWFYYQERSARFDATWKKRLRHCSWIPKDGSDTPNKPGEISLSDLPEQFDRNEKLADLLGMKKDFVSKLAEEAGLPVEDIDLLRRYPDEFSQWKAQIAARNENPVFPTKKLKDSERRRERIIEQLADSPKKKYEPRTRLVRTTEATQCTRIWLKEQYTNDVGQMVCQICKQEMPFRKRDDEYYFEAVEALSRKHFTKEHEAQFLALCPLCAAMYKEFIKRDEDAMDVLKRKLINADGLEVSITLGKIEKKVEFVQTHYFDLKTILGVPDAMI